MEQNAVKARRNYLTTSTPACGGFPGVPGEVVRVTGFEELNGERWCRIRYAGDRVSSMLMHPSNLAAEVL